MRRSARVDAARPSSEGGSGWARRYRRPMDSSRDRHERLRMLVVENQRRRHRPQRLRELAAATGVKPSPDDFLALPATQQLWQAVRDRPRYHLVWHRIWGDRLSGEVAKTLRDMADQLEGVEAYLLWPDPPEAVLVRVSPLLRHIAEHLSPQSDLTLATGDAKSGLVLAWDHLAYADEYSLVTWGELAFDLTVSP